MLSLKMLKLRDWTWNLHILLEIIPNNFNFGRGQNFKGLVRLFNFYCSLRKHTPHPDQMPNNFLATALAALQHRHTRLSHVPKKPVLCIIPRKVGWQPTLNENSDNHTVQKTHFTFIFLSLLSVFVFCFSSLLVDQYFK